MRVRRHSEALGLGPDEGRSSQILHHQTILTSPLELAPHRDDDLNMTTPATPADLAAHLVEAHGWTPGPYDPSMIQAHRTAHGADLPSGSPPPQLDHHHAFQGAKAANAYRTGLIILMVALVCSYLYVVGR